MLHRSSCRRLRQRARRKVRCTVYTVGRRGWLQKYALQLSRKCYLWVLSCAKNVQILATIASFWTRRRFIQSIRARGCLGDSGSAPREEEDGGASEGGVSVSGRSAQFRPDPVLGRAPGNQHISAGAGAHRVSGKPRSEILPAWKAQGRVYCDLINSRDAWWTCWTASKLSHPTPRRLGRSTTPLGTRNFERSDYM